MKQRLLVSLLSLLVVSTLSAQPGTGARGQRQDDRTGSDIIGGTFTPESITASGLIKSTNPTAGIGYATGAGGAVTQITSRTTTVVLSKVSGVVTTTADSMAAQAPTTFTVTNTTVALGDVVVLSKVSGDVDTFAWVNSVAAGSFTVTLFNTHASAADTTAFAFNFVVIKAVGA